MNRKPFLVLVVVLAALAAATAGILVSERGGWRSADARVGQKVIPGLKLGEVAEIAIRDESRALHLARGDGGWKVRERADFPADVERIGDLLVKMAELKVVQAEPLPENQRARLQLVEPKEKGAKDTGTALELKDAKGAALARLILGKKVLRRTELAALGNRDEGLPSGRYIVSGGDSATMVVVSEPFALIEPKPDLWLAKDLIRAERVKSIRSLGPDGRQRWTMVRDGDNADWKFAGSSDKPDLQKATDAAGSLSWMNLVDVVVDPINTETGLSRATTIRAETFDNLTYTVRIGNKTGDNYYVGLAVSGEPPKIRTAGKDEKAGDKEKQDKEFEDARKKLMERIERERKLDRWRYVVTKSGVEPLLRDRAQLLPEKKAGRKKG
jgi:hypothetical protein